MHRSDEIPQSESMEPAMEVHISEPDGSLTFRWTTMASAAAGAALGMPFDSRTAFRAAWVEVSQRIAALRK